MEIGSLTIRMAAEVANLRRDMDSARRTVDKASSDIQRAADKAKRALAGIAGGITVAAFATKLVAVQRQFDVLNSSLITVTGSAAKAEQEFKWIKQFAATTPYQLNEVTGAFVKMKSLGLDASAAALNSYGNTASAMGKGLNQMIEAVADAATGEFERLKEFGIKAKKQGDEVSLTFQGVTTNIGNNAEEITNYLRKIGDNEFAGAMAQRAMTLDGAISNLGDTWDELFRTISNQNAGTLIHDSVRMATRALQDAITVISALGGATNATSSSFDRFKGVQEAIAITLETVLVVAENVRYVLSAIGNDIGAIIAVYAAVLRGDWAQAAEIGKMARADAKAARAEHDKITSSILNARRLRDIAATGEGMDEPRFRRLLEGGETAAKAVTERVTKHKVKKESDYSKEMRKFAEDEEKHRQAMFDKRLDEEEKAVQKALDDKKKMEEEYEKEMSAFRDAEDKHRQDMFNKRMADQEREEKDAVAASKKAYEKAYDEQVKEWADAASKMEDMLTDALMRGFENGKSFGQNLADSVKNLFKTYVAKAIAQAITQAIMSAIAGTQWANLFSGVFGGGGGIGGNLGSSVSSLSSMYSAYSTAAGGGAGAAGATGGSASAIGSFAGGSMSAGNTAGSIYANATGTGIDGLLSANGAYGTTAGGGGGWMAAAGYAALIVAAIAIANNLYSKGYTRAALGIGGPQEVGFNNTTFQTDPSLQKWGGDSGFEAQKRGVLEGIGINEKWSDILSGTTRLAATFGRKLGAYGYEAAVGPEGTAVGGYQQYKGGLFRSDKTKRMDVDPRDIEMIQQAVEGVKQSARATAIALGLSAEAVDAYTGSLTVNMKNATTAEEQAKRLGEAMEGLYYDMVKAASGGTLTKEAFQKLMADVQLMVEQAGISVNGMVEIIAAGMTGRMSEAQVGEAMASMVIGGIYNTLATPFAQQIATVFQAQIVTPIFTAIMAGVPLSQVISQQAIANVVATAQQAAAALNAIFSSAEFQSAIKDIDTAISGISAAAVKPAASLPRLKNSFNGVASAASNAADKAKQLKEAWKQIADSLLDEIKRIRGELVSDTDKELSYYQAQLAIATAKAKAGDKEAAKEIPNISQALIDAARLSSSTQAEFNTIQAQTLAALESLRQFIGKKYKFSLPSFDVGTDYVEQDMIAQVHKGERIMTADENSRGRIKEEEYYADMRYSNKMMNSALVSIAIHMESLDRNIGRVVEEDYIKTKEEA